MARRLKCLPLTNTQKQRIVQANILPAALYGVEAAYVAKGRLQQLRSAIGQVLGPRSTRACVDVVFDCLDACRDRDPGYYVAYQRLSQLRRTLSKQPWRLHDFQIILREYANHFRVGSEPPTKGIHGPIGFALHSLWQIGITLGSDLRMSTATHTPALSQGTVVRCCTHHSKRHTRATHARSSTTTHALGRIEGD